MAKSRPEVSVVVPAFQAATTIGRCVKALRAQTLSADEYEVIVVDDGSRDDTAAEAARAGARVLRLATNRGPGGARNAGIAVARGELIVFTDADCEPTQDFLARLTSHLRDPQVAGSKGVYITKQRGLVARFVQREYEQRYRYTARQAEIDFVDTYACCFRREAIVRNGGFDARFRVCEDQELSFRLTRAGERIVFAPDARTYHQHCDNCLAYVRKKFRIARWKARVLRRYPCKTLHDSHTPPLLKLEIALAYAVAFAIGLRLGPKTGSSAERLGGRVTQRLLPCALIAYACAMAPFIVPCGRRDPSVALVAPAMLFARDLALGAGLLVGSVQACAS